jgi:hypothetical protein
MVPSKREVSAKTAITHVIPIYRPMVMFALKSKQEFMLIFLLYRQEGVARGIRYVVFPPASQQQAPFHLQRDPKTL